MTRPIGQGVSFGPMKTARLWMTLVGAIALLGCPMPEPDPEPEPIVAVTWNTGTTESMGHDQLPDDGYSSAHAALSDEHYGDGLAWLPAIDAARAFFAEVEPDVVVFQEIFWSDECAAIPQEAWGDFVCEQWSAGDPTVAQAILGEGWQVACHPGKPDKCAAVHGRLGRFSGCDDDFCLEGLEGFTVDGCGSGARVGRGAIVDADGASVLTLVNVHGSSGITGDDKDCRRQQVEQVFVDLGDGEPAANGAINLVMGDLNTDPGRWTGTDQSAARWNDFAGEGLDFHFITDVGPDVTPSYSDLVNIDHVLSDVLEGACTIAGIEGEPPVTDAVYFDHKPVTCSIVQLSSG
jgi:hypothetical protein